MEEINPNNFWNRVVKPEDPNDCWMWQGKPDVDGYGRIYGWNKGTKVTYKAHNYSFWLHNGYITPELQRMHSCDTRLCVAPHHLSEGTALENNQDMISKGRNRQLKAEHHPNAKLLPDEVAEIRRKYATGQYLQTELGQKFHMDNTTIQKIIDNILWPDPNYTPPTFDRSRNAATVMSWDKVHEIRRLHKLQHRNKDLVKQFGGSAPLITAITKNKRWYDPEYVP